MFLKAMLLWKLVFEWRSAHIVVVVVVHIPSPIEIGGSFVLMRSSILQKISTWPSCKRMSATYILISPDSLVYVAGREFVEFFVVAKNDDCHVDRTKDGKLMRLLEKAAFALEECAIRKQSANVPYFLTI